MPQHHQPKPTEPIQVVTSRGRARYRVKTDAGTRANGKRQQVVRTFDTLGQARHFLKELRVDLAAGRHRAPNDMNLDQLCSRWLDGKDDVRPITLEGYVAVLRPVRHRIGSRRVQTLTYDDMLALKRWLEKEGGQRGGPLSERTIRMTFVALAQVLDEGMRARLVTENVARLVKTRQRRNYVDPTRWSPSELMQFRDHADHDEHAAAWRLVLCGMRRSEVLGLDWQHVNLMDGTVAIVQGRVPLAVTTGVRDHLDEPKSKQSWRSLPVESIHPGTLGLLRDYKRRAEAIGSHGLIVVHADREPVRPEWFSYRFRRLCASAGVPVIRLHAVRHSVADVLAGLGVPPVDAAAMLGHTTSVFLDTYARTTPAGATLAAARLGEALRKLGDE